jgi:hypothetical protein
VALRLCRWGNAGALALNWTHPLLKQRMLDLSPSFLRMGGSPQDFVVYDVGNPPVCDGLCLSMERWADIHAVLRESGNRLVFGIADLYGIVRHKQQYTWNSSNARALLQESRDQGYDIDTIALGNEPTSCFSYTVPSELLERLVQLRTIVDDIWGDLPRSERPIITAPDIDCEATAFLLPLLNGSAGMLDATTFHHYAATSDLPQSLLDPARLDEATPAIKALVANASLLAPSTDRGGVWAGESGPAGNAYLPGHSLGYAYVPWYMDELSLFATLGVRRVMRQTLVGGYYALVDWNATLWDPQPDYYAAYLYKTLVGTTVLQAEVQPTVPAPAGTDPTLFRAYANCARENRTTGASGAGRAVWVLINLSQTTTWTVSLPDAELAEQWALTPLNGTLTAQTIQLNGKSLAVDSSGMLPPMPSVATTSPNTVDISPLGVTFVRSKPGMVPACA